MIALLSVAVVMGMVLESNQQVLLKESNAVLPAKVNEDDPHIPRVPPELRANGYNTSIQCWTDWFDRDDPNGNGDHETLKKLRKENRGRICKRPINIEAKTLSGLSPAEAGDVISVCDTNTGFSCKNHDQPKKKCQDYRVRFSCHPPFCGIGACWTKWYDRDDPSGKADWEALKNLRKENPGEICDDPLYIEAVTVDTNTPALNTGDNLYFYNPTQGFACFNGDQKHHKLCRDYKVRFGCCCGH